MGTIHYGGEKFSYPDQLVKEFLVFASLCSKKGVVELVRIPDGDSDVRTFLVGNGIAVAGDYSSNEDGILSELDLLAKDSSAWKILKRPREGGRMF